MQLAMYWNVTACVAPKVGVKSSTNLTAINVEVAKRNVCFIGCAHLCHFLLRFKL